ncbi:NEDD8 isoform X3 [Pyrgilauda ruficollis]|uniref:NEDD8 isoform X3 n=1 Tax=Pyrgilauda ruficollis TaxID=221976 RepID=UPI001B86CD70|nr:NEDD8 isoform X3 [Pyrgilauda ruficollis]
MGGSDVSRCRGAPWWPWPRSTSGSRCWEFWEVGGAWRPSWSWSSSVEATPLRAPSHAPSRSCSVILPRFAPPTQLQHHAHFRLRKPHPHADGERDRDRHRAHGQGELPVRTGINQYGPVGGRWSGSKSAWRKRRGSPPSSSG